MEGRILGFVLWVIVGTVFIGLGVFCFFAKKEAGFWANAKTFPVEDIKGYNRSMGKLWLFYGGVFILLGLPFLEGQNTPLIALLTMPGVMIETIVTMCVYTLVIEKKYRRK